MIYKFAYPVISLDLYDGDTQTVEVDMGFCLKREVSTRVYGLDFPENRPRKDVSPEPELEKETAYLVNEVTLQWLQKRMEQGFLMLASMEWIVDEEDKYGRVLCDYFSLGNHKDTYSKWALENELCVPYDGGTKKLWYKDDLLAIQDRTRKVTNGI